MAKETQIKLTKTRYRLGCLGVTISLSDLSCRADKILGGVRLRVAIFADLTLYLVCLVGHDTFLMAHPIDCGSQITQFDLQKLQLVLQKLALINQLQFIPAVALQLTRIKVALSPVLGLQICYARDQNNKLGDLILQDMLALDQDRHTRMFPERNIAEHLRLAVKHPYWPMIEISWPELLLNSACSPGLWLM